MAPDTRTRSSRLRALLGRLRAILVSYFLPLGFLCATIIALCYPRPGRAVARVTWHGHRVVEFVNNATFFLLSGLTLKTTDFAYAATHWVAVVYGVVVILGVTPLLALWVQRVAWVHTTELRTGLAIFYVVPTTLGVGVALTQVARGNQVMALLLSVLTKLLGVATIPYMLYLLLGHTSAGRVEPAPMLLKLTLTVLVPTVLGMVLRALSTGLRAFVTAHRTAVSLLASANLVMLVWQTLSGARDRLMQQDPRDLLLVALLTIALHVLCLCINAVVSVYILRLPVSEAIAIIFMSSQKSAPVAVTVISFITHSLSTQGLLAIPCIIGQLAQVFIGSILAQRMALWVECSATVGPYVSVRSTTEGEEELEGCVDDEKSVALEFEYFHGVDVRSHDEVVLLAQGAREEHRDCMAEVDCRR